MKKLLNQVIDGLLAAVPLERIVAAGLNILIGRIGREPVAKTAKTLAHIREACDLTERILADGQISDAEIGEARERLQFLRITLLDTWASGEPSKTVETALAQAAQ